MADAIVIDLTKYKDRSGSRVPEGRYRVQVEDIEVSKSKTNKEMITLWLRITGGDYDGYTVIDRLTITEKALFRVVNFMQALNMPTPKKRVKIIPQKWVGRTLEIDVADGEPYNGNVKSEVKGYLRLPKGQDEDTSDDLGDDEDDTEEDVEETPTEESKPKSKKGMPSLDDEDQSIGDDSGDEEDDDTDVEEMDVESLDV